MEIWQRPTSYFPCPVRHLKLSYISTKKGKEGRYGADSIWQHLPDMVATCHVCFSHVGVSAFIREMQLKCFGKFLGMDCGLFVAEKSANARKLTKPPKRPSTGVMASKPQSVSDHLADKKRRGSQWSPVSQSRSNLSA